MAKVRVIRVLEYTYDSIEEADNDRLRWTDHTPFSVIKNTRTTMRTVGVLTTYLEEGEGNGQSTGPVTDQTT